MDGEPLGSQGGRQLMVLWLECAWSPGAEDSTGTASVGGQVLQPFPGFEKELQEFFNTNHTLAEVINKQFWNQLQLL